MMKNKLYKFILFLTTIIILGIFLVMLIKNKNLTYNKTPSFPIGYYSVDKNNKFTKGDLVQVCPPATTAFYINNHNFIEKGKNCSTGTIPLIKKIVAMAGDTVEVNSTGVFVNNIKLQKSRVIYTDANGKQMKPCWGKYQLKTGKIWIMSDYNDRSFDSRYFCEVPTENVIGRAKLLLEF